MDPKILSYIPTDMHKAGAGEWVGPCPKCGGEDRFSVTAKDKPGGGLFFCRGPSVGRRGCDWSGDIFTLLKDLQGLEYCEARAHLGMEPDEFCKEQSEQQKEEAERKRRIAKRKRRKKYQSWKRLVRQMWLKDHMTEGEMAQWKKILEPPERVRKARKVLSGYLDTYAETGSDTSNLSPSAEVDKNLHYPLESMTPERLYGGQRWSDLPDDRVPRAKELLQETRKTEEEVQQQKEEVQQFLHEVEERLNAEGIFFEEYEKQANLKEQFEESSFPNT